MLTTIKSGRTINFIKIAFEKLESLIRILFKAMLTLIYLLFIWRGTYWLMRATSITRATGRDGPWKLRHFWALKWQRAKRMPFGPKKKQGPWNSVYRTIHTVYTYICRQACATPYTVFCHGVDLMSYFKRQKVLITDWFTHCHLYQASNFVSRVIEVKNPITFLKQPPQL